MHTDVMVVTNDIKLYLYNQLYSNDLNKCVLNKRSHYSIIPRHNNFVKFEQPFNQNYNTTLLFYATILPLLRSILYFK